MRSEKSAPYRTCGLLPTYNNPLTIRRMVEEVRQHLPDIILVDDGSSSPAQELCAALASEGLVTLVRLERNQGKGAAVVAGLAQAQEMGFTHAFQIDADGQHDVSAMSQFLEASRKNPEGLVLGYPLYRGAQPRSRRWARRLTGFWVGVELGDRSLVTDAMIGFRVYPIVSTLAARPKSCRMDFDIEIIVRMVRAGIAVVNLRVGVTYPDKESGGISHFRPLMDNLSFCGMHTRLCMSGIFGWVVRCLTGRPT